MILDIYTNISNSWHELGVYDLAAMIDYIISVTGQVGITYIGHSMGATIAAVLLSQRPEYNSKIKLLILLAPVVKLEHNTSVLRFSAPFWKSLQVGTKLLLYKPLVYFAYIYFK